MSYFIFIHEKKFNKIDGAGRLLPETVDVTKVTIYI